jgi:hypothetical protein
MTPFMSALFTRNQRLIDGILMDATWKIVRVSVASILMFSICNVRIPVILAIGLKEDKVLYQVQPMPWSPSTGTEMRRLPAGMISFFRWFGLPQ